MVDLVSYVGIDRVVSMTRVACDASSAKRVSFVAYRDYRRSDNQRILLDKFHWLARFVFEVLFQHHWELLGSV